jgi:hypothetical protein
MSASGAFLPSQNVCCAVDIEGEADIPSWLGE